MTMMMSIKQSAQDHPQLLAVQAVTPHWVIGAQGSGASNSRPLGPQAAIVTTEPRSHSVHTYMY